jgi:nucleoside diphosphate kinase
MQQADFFDKVLQCYAQFAPEAFRTYLSLNPIGSFARPDSTQQNLDHVAFRTFNRGPVRLQELEIWLTARGYVATGDYNFVEKRLRARSFSNHDASIPRVFVSELLVEQQSVAVQKVIDDLIIGSHIDPQFPWCSTPWPKISSVDYDTLLNDSGDYAAWTAINGLRPNHLTVSVKDRIHKVISWLESDGRVFRTKISYAGGAVKGGPAVLLEQGSTVADLVPYDSSDGHTIYVPAAYCEFAHRWVDPLTNQLFDGFVESSANKIFESTDLRQPDVALAIVKPDAMRRDLSNKLLMTLLSEGLELVEVQRIHMTSGQAEALYLPHKGKDFYESLINFMTSGVSMVIKLRGIDCTTRLRRIVELIRSRYMMSISENVIHGSDSIQAGQREVQIFFPN